LRLHTDIPTRGQVSLLFTTLNPACVSIYLPTDPASLGQAERIALKNLISEAVDQLTEAGHPKRQVAAVEEQLTALLEDDEFWRYQARTLAVFATPDFVITYRLPNRIVEFVEVADRFHLMPLLRSITFPQVALTLALSQKRARLYEVLPEGGPSKVRVPDLPRGVLDAVRINHVDDRAPRGKTQSSKIGKTHLRTYCRRVDQAIKPVLAGRDVPLILAAAEPLESIYRSVNTYPHLAPKAIPGNPEEVSNAELADRTRQILDELYAQELADLHALFDERKSEGRTATDVATVARAATYAMVDTLFVDMDSVLPGFVDEQGEIQFAETDDASAYAIVDEITRRVWMYRGTVLAVRRPDVPEGGDVAAILRFPLPT
jgi:hypothetical protein